MPPDLPPLEEDDLLHPPSKYAKGRRPWSSSSSSSLHFSSLPSFPWEPPPPPPWTSPVSVPLIVGVHIGSPIVVVVVDSGEEEETTDENSSLSRRRSASVRPIETKGSGGGIRGGTSSFSLADPLRSVCWGEGEGERWSVFGFSIRWVLLLLSSSSAALLLILLLTPSSEVLPLGFSVSSRRRRCSGSHAGGWWWWGTWFFPSSPPVPFPESGEKKCGGIELPLSFMMPLAAFFFPFLDLCLWNRKPKNDKVKKKKREVVPLKKLPRLLLFFFFVFLGDCISLCSMEFLSASYTSKGIHTNISM